MASRYASYDSRASPSTSGDLKKAPSRPHLSAIRNLIANTSGRRRPSDPLSTAIVKATDADSAVKTEHNLGAMVRKLMEKKPTAKPKSADKSCLIFPVDPIAEDARKAAKGGTGFGALHRKLFQKAAPAQKSGSKVKALTEVKSNTRTLAMVLRSERDLLGQNKDYETEILDLKISLEEKFREVDKLKELCLKQREEIKALKDAILFPEVMNTQLQTLLEQQGSELKQAKQVIPNLEKQVTSLTGLLHCLADDLAEVKADKYSGRICSDGSFSSPRTPIYVKEAAGSVEFNSAEPMHDSLISGSPDNMFLKDVNPCLTPCFSNMKSKGCDEMIVYDTQCKKESFGNKLPMSSNSLFTSNGGKLSKSSENNRKLNSSRISRKACKSEETNPNSGKITSIF